LLSSGKDGWRGWDSIPSLNIIIKLKLPITVMFMGEMVVVKWLVELIIKFYLAQIKF
jgi:hypothetical protein